MFAGTAAPAPTVPARSYRGAPGYSFPSTPIERCYTRDPGPEPRSAPRPGASTGCTAAQVVTSVIALARNPSCYPSPTMAAAKLTTQEIGELRTRLESERGELAAQLTTIEDQAFAATQSDMSGDVGVDDESADAGTATFEREKELSIEQNVRDLIQKIDRALKRIDDGTYGICERCGKPIEKARIKALPYVDLCIKDAQARSRR